MGLYGAVRESVDCKKDHRTVIGGSDRQSYHCTQTKTIKHFDKRVFSECSEEMFSRRVVTLRYSTQDLAHAL